MGTDYGAIGRRMNCTLTIMWEIKREREREKGIRDRKEREKGNGRIDRELNFISFSKGRNERKRGEGEEKKENRVRVSEFASVKEQAYEGEGRKAKSEADLRAVEKSSLFLSLFFCSPSSNFFQHQERSCLLETPRSFEVCFARWKFLPFFHSFV